MFKTVIFDCDGVLIDSEILVCHIVADALQAAGVPTTVDTVTDQYIGRPIPVWTRERAAAHGVTLTPDFFVALSARITHAYEHDLRAIPGVADVLAGITLPVCVASSSLPDKLRLGLSQCGLYDAFAPNILSASGVRNGKPSPDIFIFAAGWMRTLPAHCLVIEDSVAGVSAAVAAGMTVWGFTGGSHCRPGQADRLRAAGAAQVFAHMNALPGLLAGIPASAGAC